MDANINLVYKIDTIEGVNVEVLCKSLKAINDEFQRFTSNNKILAIKEVRKGSGIFEFMEQVVIPVFASMEVINTTVQFAEYLSSVKNVLLGRSEKPSHDIPLTKESIDNVGAIMLPTIIGDNNTVTINVDGTILFSANEQEFRAMQKSKRLINPPKENTVTKSQIYKKVAFEWKQTNFENKKTGNSGAIDKIQVKPVKVIFADDKSKSKRQMTKGNNWQDVIYIVDVETIVNNNKIVSYKILENYPDDSITIETNENPDLF